MIDADNIPPVAVTSVFLVSLRLLKLEICVPRRFGLGALLVVSGCFGMLCALLSHLNTHWLLVEVICVMLLLIGTLQTATLLTSPGLPGDRGASRRRRRGASSGKDRSAGRDPPGRAA